MCFCNKRNIGEIIFHAHTIVPYKIFFEMGNFNIILIGFNRFFVKGENTHYMSF